MSLTQPFRLTRQTVAFDLHLPWTADGKLLYVTSRWAKKLSADVCFSALEVGKPHHFLIYTWSQQPFYCKFHPVCVGEIFALRNIIYKVAYVSREADLQLNFFVTSSPSARQDPVSKRVAH